MDIGRVGRSLERVGNLLLLVDLLLLLVVLVRVLVLVGHAEGQNGLIGLGSHDGWWGRGR
jgi:hypothetical protein